jgi:uncharacterized protein (TIGR03382 family)
MLVTTNWEVSADNGLSWQAGTVQVPQSQSSVLVRHVVTWGTPGQGDYIVNGGVIPTVRTTGLVGLSDTASSIQRRQIVMQPTPSIIAGRRFTGNELVVSASVSAPPTGAITFFGFDPILGTTAFGNPIDVLQFQLTLDGSAGERVISDWTDTSSRYNVVAAATPGPYTYTFAHNSTTLVVIPSPAGLAVAGVAGVVLLRRRRTM